MGWHINAKIKYNYVKRYINGESIKLLAIELIKNKLTQQKKPNNVRRLIYNWNSKYRKFGFNGLISKTGKKKGPGKGRPPKN